MDCHEVIFHRLFLFNVVCGLISRVLICIFCRSAKNKQNKLESEYMVDSTSSGPRPYNVETLDRKTAQSTLVSARHGAYDPTTVPT